MGKNLKWLWLTAAILAIVGGVEHLLEGFFSTTLLTIFGSWASVVQGLAGVATVLFVWQKLK